MTPNNCVRGKLYVFVVMRQVTSIITRAGEVIAS